MKTLIDRIGTKVAFGGRIRARGGASRQTGRRPDFGESGGGPRVRAIPAIEALGT